MTATTPAAEDSARPARIVVVEDNDEIADIVATALRFDGHDVHVAGTGKAGLEQIRLRSPELVVLDVMLPDTDGFAIQRELVADPTLHPAVLFLTARDDSVDVVRALELGADDYVRKPFSIDEVLARVRLVLRRARAASAPVIDDAPLQVHDLSLHPLSRDVLRGDRELQLTPREFELLRYLMQNAGIVLSKSQILDTVWQYDFGGDGNVVEIYVGYLRRKLEENGEPRLIHTVRGVGYCLRAPKGS
ncbi:MAG: response regulator transcription factor [Thermoleophilia bacterium]|nr:response regulator transcription factor [Thermoleophilia bacterium]